MKIIEPSYNIESPIEADSIYRAIEVAGRTCYKSEGKTGPGTAAAFVANIIARGHESVLEHISVTVRFICDRGVSHELVRHRLAGFSQESTRYCNYHTEKFEQSITFIQPPFFNGTQYPHWARLCKAAEDAYFKLIELGAQPQEARSVLPNSLKTEVVMTANIREWRHVLRLRATPKAHPQMRQLMVPLLNEFAEKLPVLFGDIQIDFMQAEGRAA